MSLVVPLEEIFASGKGVLSSHTSWERVELGEVCTILNGFAFKSAQFNNSSGFPVIRIRDLGKNRTETLYDGDFPPGYIVENGDLLVGMDGIFRCCEWHGGEAALNQRVCKITPDEQFLNRKFLLYALNGYLKAIEDATSSVTVGHLSSRDILRIPFPLPPLEEQNRIAGKLDGLTEKVGTCILRLERIPTILKRFRQSVLAAACSGRLTADWREQHSAGDENGSTRVGFDDEFPETWRTTNLGKLASLVTSGSRGWAKYYADTGSTFIRAQNINSDVLNLDDVAFVQLPNRAEGVRTKVHRDDILVTITGANVTKSALVDVDLEDAYISQHVALVRLHEPSFAAFLFLWIVSPSHGRRQLQDAAYGQGKPGLNLDNIRDVDVVVPPLDEQKEIVRRVESLFTLADQLEARYKKGKAYVDKLTQSILAKAFRGELVPQDPNDEPAEKLLERIRGDKVMGETALRST